MMVTNRRRASYGNQLRRFEPVLFPSVCDREAKVCDPLVVDFGDAIMIEHIVEISQPIGPSAKVRIRLNPGGWGTWRTLDKGFFCYEGGLADTGNDSTAPIAWVALYGDDMPDDKKLVLHLDGFRSFAGVERAGDGLVYAEDHLLMRPGKVTWKLLGI